MKIAIPIDGDIVNQHYGKSKTFIVASINDNNIETIEELSTSSLAHEHEGLADLLVRNSVTIVIVGGIGMGALTALEEKGLKVLRGTSGKYRDVINAYLNNSLKTKNVICNHHDC
ncbi:NifB/NifX family molybdenum-iron cluster-binding protein [Clostridium sp. DJ247]|uniref:NifB/NifX family molybdenum-iron cluster-binding protein n=1 Tax=Clostridium sp. DJ247 TaxID=2726188 RepID=UPI00162AF61C|nr:NifB/NifX family molybdenum-iron cluster-binding protein [Clostridium sp. DJ247]MBC2581716.1 diguanylate cyclase [Clostridium sp. DJ247]